MDDYRETIWGISPRDRGWFQLFTLLGGIVGSVILAVLELDSAPVDATLAETARNIVLGIGASFVAAGFVAWGLLQARDIMSDVTAWIRAKTKKREDRLLERGREEGHELGVEKGLELGIEEGRRLGREEVLREIYGPDYTEPSDGNPGQTDDGGDSGERKANGV